MTRPAIIIAHGQPSDPAPQEAAIRALAAAVAAAAPGRQVSGATLAAPGALAQAVTRAPGALIYPMFMAAGWFTTTELPRRLAQAGAGTGAEAGSAQVLAPFGLDPALPGLCARLAGAAAAARGWAARDCTLLLIAHGSGRSRASAQGAQAMAAVLRPSFARVTTGFIEEPPFLHDAARDLGTHAIALPFFATRAGHVTDDIPQALAGAGFSGPCLGPVGLAAPVPALIAAALARAEAAIAPGARDA
ncbi:MAG: CbiX/SirB N-terminal domain-containing protein [Paracoccus sp. (in: a-proteobacteria)]|nr:CbiX/SirB N-terminal domain-containing protein [Paracoccus sp. (in: a-proteobacteria)]